MRGARIPSLLTLALGWAATAAVGQEPTTLFADDFERGIEQWTLPEGRGVRLLPSDDPERGMVLALRTEARPAIALMRGSEHWGSVRVEGRVLFPENAHAYLGLVYRYTEANGRTDFGNLYIKGNGSYVRANPHRDLNVGRTLYEEYRTPLVGEAAITIGAWQRFALEVVGGEAHLYVGDMARPQVTFPHFGGASGAFGFSARNPGAAVWIDDVRVSSIGSFSWRGPPIPEIAWDRDQLVTEWEVLGPLQRFHPEVETGALEPDLLIVDGSRTLGWRPFPTDARGAVLTGRVTEHEGYRGVAYFLARIRAPRAGEVPIVISSVDDLAVWLNGDFLGFRARDRLAWWDVASNPDRGGGWGRVRLREGENLLLVRVNGGTYASGGFFLGVGLPEPR